LAGIRIALVFVMLISLALTGCGQDSVREFHQRQAGAADSPGSFDAEINLFSRLDSDSGELSGPGESFWISDYSHVRGAVEIRNTQVDEVHSLHLVWIRPDDREITRRYAEVKITPDEDGFRSTISWRKARDLVTVKEEIQNRPEASFTLTSRLKTVKSDGTPRDPGQYLMRVYWNREFLLEKPFVLLADSIRAGDPLAANITFCRRVSQKSGRRLGIGTEFKRMTKSRVYAFTDFQNTAPDRCYPLDLAWYAPDGTEMSRRHVEVAITASEAGYRSHVRWYRPGNANWIREEIQESAEPGFSLRRYITSSLKKREAGRYAFRVYLGDQLLQEEWFELE